MPAVIYQRLADRISDRLLAGDLDGCIACLQLPFSLATNGGATVYSEVEQLRAALDASYQSMRVRKITDHIRLVQEAQFVGPDKIIGTHTTNTLVNGLRDIAPYLSRMVLDRGRDAIWRVSSADHAIENTAFPVLRPAVEDGDHLPDGPEMSTTDIKLSK
ncbi:hypothetical protein ABMC88_01115 [Sulfitobacter sp. HNIBRBA2951]|uniref:hypothetical protein n=1 Tax=Sulfitobacter aquimarinus TaxID=3158557 RepID=UPI0032DEB80A